MKQAMLMLVAGALFASGSPAEVLYEVPAGDETAILTVDGTTREVSEGDAIPGLGEVVHVGPDEVVVERVLGIEERERLLERGLAAPDIERRILPRSARGGSGVRFDEPAPLR